MSKINIYILNLLFVFVLQDGFLHVALCGNCPLISSWGVAPLGGVVC